MFTLPMEISRNRKVVGGSVRKYSLCMNVYAGPCPGLPVNFKGGPKICKRGPQKV